MILIYEETNMKKERTAHFMYVPLLGLGLYGGYRGTHWLRNRIKIFKQFVVPSLLAQTSKDFILWISVRYEDRRNPQIQKLKEYLEGIKGFKTVFTYAGICFWDDKYEDIVARERLVNAVHGSIGELISVMGECDNVLITLQPSDDCYETTAVRRIQEMFEKDRQAQAITYTNGYICNYQTKEVAEYTPLTNPPFFTIKFPTEIFKDPMKHIEFTGPYKSHEYIGEKLELRKIIDRGYLVGTHGENISTFFDHPFKKSLVDNKVLRKFGLSDVEPLKIRKTWRGYLYSKLPHMIRRKLRYYLGERFYARLYDILRG